jgi:hypothetical protein
MRAKSEQLAASRVDDKNGRGEHRTTVSELTLAPLPDIMSAACVMLFKNGDDMLFKSSQL